MRRSFQVYIAMVTIAFVSLGFLRLKSETPKDVFLTEGGDIRQISSYHRLLTYPQSDSGLERYKVDFLFERLRHSPYTFLRNGAPYSGQKAANHLLWKYRRRTSTIPTARRFAEELGSRSSETGELYMVQTSAGHLYPLRDILLNELRRLEDYLLRDRKSQTEALLETDSPRGI